MDQMNPNVVYYIKCRDHLNVKCALIYNECKLLFRHESPKTSRSVIKILELKELYPENSYKQETQDELNLQNLNEILGLQFQIKRICEYQTPQKISFYICCRYQLTTDFISILNELKVLYPTYEHTLANVEQIVSFCFNVNQKFSILPSIDNFVQVKNELIETQVEAKHYQLVNFNRIQLGNETYNSLQEKLELADLECAKLRSTIKLLNEEKEELLSEYDKHKAEFETYKRENEREIYRLKHKNSCLQDANKIEQDSNLILRSNLSSYGYKIDELLKDLSSKSEEAESWKTKYEKLLEERDTLLKNNIKLDKHLKQKIESDNMHRDRLMKATSFIEQLQKSNENFKKENHELKTTSERVEYLKHLNETSKHAKNLKEKTDQLDRLQKEFDLNKETSKNLEIELKIKKEAWIDQANTIKQLEVQILNLKTVNFDLETRLRSNYYNIYASNYFQSTNFRRKDENKFNRAILGCSSSDQKNSDNVDSSEEKLERPVKLQKLMEIEIPNVDIK